MNKKSISLASQTLNTYLHSIHRIQYHVLHYTRHRSYSQKDKSMIDLNGDLQKYTYHINSA